MVKIPLKAHGFEPFPEFYFSFTNEMDENKLPFNNFFKLGVQE
jgi:hypothetical protein